jgi:hypothetical protein
MKQLPLATLAGATLLAGCVLSLDGGRAPLVPAGSELIVHQRLPLPGSDARVFIQDGRIVTGQEIDRFRVTCAIALRRRGEEQLVEAIRPGEFLVVGNSRSWARSRPGGDGNRFMGRPSRLDYVTEMEIRSDLQPQVDELRCRYNGHRLFAEVPGAAAIRETLGALATLKLPPDAP